MGNFPLVRKIKTITCHDVYNFGASLQAYALMKYLQNLGHQVEIIDYKPYYMTYSLWAIGEKWKRNIFLSFLYFLYVIPSRLMLKARRRKFDQFTRDHLTLTPECFYSNEDLKNNPPDAEIYFAGSDQIWNVLHNHGKDPAFYLDFVQSGAVRASYAASFSISSIPDEYKEFIKGKLEKFSAISVREESGLKILKSLNIVRGIVVLDPVFLLDRDSWNNLSVFNPTERYILIYDQENNKLIQETAIRMARELDLKIYAIKSLYPMSYADRKIIKAGPVEFLGLISNCEICLTNSFHCTAFSLIFQKEFFTFRRNHESVNSRMIDLLEMLQIKERIFDNYENLRNTKKINYQIISNIIYQKLQSSRDYINYVIRLTDSDE